MSRVALRFSGRSALALIFTPAPFIRRAGALLSGLAIFVSATTPMFAGSGTFTISPTVMCVGGTVSVTVNSPCVSTEGSTPWVTVGFSLVGTHTGTNISLYTNASGAWMNQLAITTAGTWSVHPTDSCGDTFGSSNLTVVQLNDITFVGGPTNSGWTSGPDSTPARNYEALKSPSNGDVVTFGLDITPTNALAATLVNWSNAIPSSNNFTATVSATNVSSNYVFATTPCGNPTSPYTAWIFWGNAPTYSFAGDTTPAIANALWSATNPNPDSDAAWVWSDLSWSIPGTELGFSSYGNEMITYKNVQYYAPALRGYSKECTTIHFNPAGIGAIVTNGFSMVQNIMAREFEATKTVRCDLGWNSDIPKPYRQTQSLDSGDSLYSIDAPSCGINSLVNTNDVEFEVHQNFQDYETLNGVVCSDTNYWHNEMLWTISTVYPYDQAVSGKSLGAGTINLSSITNAEWYP